MTFVFSGYELDPRRQELRKAGEVVHVEPQVYDLLVLLVQNRDRIVSKDEILSSVWGGRIVSEAALSSRINAARRAVGDSGEAQNLIRTYHKRGFRFVGTLDPGEQEEAGSDLPQRAVAHIAPSLTSEPQDRGGPGRPSVAVMPFTNVNQDPEHDYFSYGLTEDVIRLLGRNRWLTVLTRHSMAQYRGRAAVDPSEAAAGLGVRYVVRGSVRTAGERVRITVELVSAADDRQLWSEVYDLALPDIFDIQEAMAQQIAAVIEPELASVERETAARKTPENLAAWDLYQRGLYHLWGFTEPGFAEAERMFTRALELEPGLARAHAGLSYVHIQMAFIDPHERADHVAAALDIAKAAVSLDTRDSLGHCVLGRAYCLKRDYASAIAALKTTVALNPSFAQGYFALAFALVWDGSEEEAIALLERATELSPRDPHLWNFHLTRAHAHFALGELDSAEHFARQSTQHLNATHRSHATLAAILGLSGQIEAAQASLPALYARKPGYTQAAAREDLFFCSRQDFVERYVEGLSRAGVPA